MLKASHPSLIAQPLSEHEWQVVAAGRDKADRFRVVGFIEVLGGIYEVGVHDRPELCQYFDTFKEAMEFFTEFDNGSHDVSQHRGAVPRAAAW